MIEDLEVGAPQISEQHMTLNILEELSTESGRLESLYQKKLTALAELKQSILQKAFAGQLTKDMKGNGQWGSDSG